MLNFLWDESPARETDPKGSDPTRLLTESGRPFLGLPAFFGLPEWVQFPVGRKWQQELESLLSGMDDQDGETRGHTRRVHVGKGRKPPLGSLIGIEQPIASCSQLLRNYAVG